MPSMPRFTALIFDMDGLMIDTEGLYWAAAREIAASYGKRAEDNTIRNMMGRAPIDSMTVFANDLGITDPPQELLDRRTVMMHERFRKPVTPMPGLTEILGAFKGRLKLAVATSAPKAFTDLILPGLGIAGFFDAIQTSDGVTHGKPHPEIYLKAIARLDVRPEESIVLEDSTAGARAGKSSGAYTIAVPSEYTRGEDFGFADYVARNLDDAREHIEGLLRG
jgi:HAD superfamily hydrolase (TIGR01509 family)